MLIPCKGCVYYKVYYSNILVLYLTKLYFNIIFQITIQLLKNIFPSSKKLFIHAPQSALSNSHLATFPACCTTQLDHTKHRHVRTTASAQKSNQTRLAWRGRWHARPMINDWQINMESKGGSTGDEEEKQGKHETNNSCL